MVIPMELTLFIFHGGSLDVRNTIKLRRSLGLFWANSEQGLWISTTIAHMKLRYKLINRSQNQSIHSSNQQWPVSSYKK